MALWDSLFSGEEKDKQKAKEYWDSAIKYFDGKLNNRALKDMGLALTLNPDYGPEALDLMQTFSQQGNEEMALSVGFALLKLEPKNFELMNKLGNSCRNTNSFAKAKKLYTYALKVNPQYTEAKYNLAASSFRIVTNDGQLISQTRKVEVYTEVRRYEFQGHREGLFPVPNQSLEEDTSKSKDEAEGEEEPTEEAKAQMLEGFVQQLKSDFETTGGTWEAAFNLALLYDLNGMGDLAIRNYKVAVEKDPQNRMSGNNLGVAMLEHGEDPKEAEGQLLKNLETHPFDRTTALNLALVYHKMGKQFQTLKYYTYLGDLLEKSLGEFETDAVEAFADDLFQRRKYLEAVPVFENLAFEKQQDHWFEKLTVMYLNQKKEDKYLLTFKRLLRINPNHEEAQNKLSEYATNYETESRDWLDKGNAARAIEYMLKAAQVEETAERWLELAQLYQDDGEEILAENALRRLKKITGEDAPGKDKEQRQASAG